MCKVGYCCCGCSLRAGSLFLIWFDAIWHFHITLTSLLYNYPLLPVVLFTVFLAIDIAALYGVYSEKPEFIFFYMAVQLINLVIYFASMVLLLIFSIEVISSELKITEILSEEQKAKFYSVSRSVIMFIVLSLGVLTALQLYFFIVVYSFCLELKEKRSHRASNIF